MKNLSVTVHETNLASFYSAINRANEKLAKHNYPHLVYEVVGEDASNDGIFYDMVVKSSFEKTNLAGIDVNYEGVVSLIDLKESAKVYSMDVKVAELVPTCTCDKCHKKIARGKYIVFSKAGKPVETRDDLIVLGRSCAKEYMPFDVERYFNGLDIIFESLGDYDENECGKHSHRSNHTPYDEVYIATCAMTENLAIYRKDGETRDDVGMWLRNDSFDYGRKNMRTEYPIPDTMVDFEIVKEWLKETYADADSVFDNNIKSVIFDENGEINRVINNKYMGLAIYALIGAKKAHDAKLLKQAKEEKRLEEVKTIEYYGNEGDKFELELNFVKSLAFDGEYGTTYYLLFTDGKHNFKWSTSCGTYKLHVKGVNCWGEDVDTDKYFDYEIGKTYKIKGTVKAHKEYKGEKQTLITRCKIVNDYIEHDIWATKEDVPVEKRKSNLKYNAWEEMEKIMESIDA